MPDELSTAVQAIARAVVRDFDDGRCILLPRPTTAPRLLAGAGLAHACLLLERLDNERLQGDDLVARLLARAHFETWLITLYVVLSPAEAHGRILAAHKSSLEAQHNEIQRENKRIRHDRKQAQSKRSQLQEQREAALSSGLSEAAARIPDIKVPEEQELDFDLSNLIADLAKIEGKALTIKQVDDRVAKLAREKGNAWAHNYSLVYRSLSYLGAHPTYWVLSHYLEAPGSLVHVRPRHRGVGPLAETAVRSGIVLTAFLASEVFGSFGVHTGFYDDLANSWLPKHGAEPTTS